MHRLVAVAITFAVVLTGCGPKAASVAGKTHPTPISSPSPTAEWFGVGQPQLVALSDGNVWSSIEVGKKGWSKAWLFSSVDEAKTWHPISVPGLESVGYFHLFDRSHAVLVDESGSAVYSTDDAGTHWSRGSLPISADGTVPASFVDTHEGWVLLTGDAPTTTLYHTRDAGKSWTKVAIPQAFVYPGSIFFRDALHGWLGHAASAPELFATRDGGQTWTAVELSSPQAYPGVVSFVDPVQVSGSELLLMVNVTEGGMGSGFPTSTYVYSSVDDGIDWSHSVRLTTGVTVATGMAAIEVQSANHWAVAIGTTFRTTFDSGKTWTSYSLEPTPGFVNAGLVFADARDGYLLLGRSADYGACLQHCFLLQLTKDGGASWRTASFPEVPADLAPP
ncbi:MAG TPA: YCF48-related protein [Candidatus Dormibacteraeota bacterium]